MMEDGLVVSPGERLATEEEFNVGSNTYVESGAIYSSAFGALEISNGTINVNSGWRNIKRIDKGMVVMGVVTDDMKSVMFVKVNDINIGRKEYLALKDGKIIADKPRMGRGRPQMGRGRGQFGEEKSEKMCAVGDTILAKVLYNDKDSYTLGIRDPEMGVVYALCEQCGSDMELDKQRMLLVCNECKRVEHRKISTYYHDAKGIKALFE